MHFFGAAPPAHQAHRSPGGFRSHEVVLHGAMGVPWGAKSCSSWFSAGFSMFIPWRLMQEFATIHRMWVFLLEKWDDHMLFTTRSLDGYNVIKIMLRLNSSDIWCYMYNMTKYTTIFFGVSNKWQKECIESRGIELKCIVNTRICLNNVGHTLTFPMSKGKDMTKCSYKPISLMWLYG